METVNYGRNKFYDTGPRDWRVELGFTQVNGLLNLAMF